MSTLETLSGPQVLLPLGIFAVVGYFIFRKLQVVKLAVLRFFTAAAVGFGLYAAIVLGGNFDELSAAQLTPDGGFIVAGETRSFGIIREDFWVLKFDSDGGVEWQMRYGGPLVDEAESIALTDDGGSIVVGHTRSFGSGIRDIWSVKLDSNGGLGGCAPEVSVQPTTASVKNSNAIPVDLQVTETNTGATSKESNATVLDTFTTVGTQCPPS